MYFVFAYVFPQKYLQFLQTVFLDKKEKKGDN